ncbi:redoxin domain-containing protein [Desulfohalovibrio reitneri]|uniref:redoxin domain-containing protein n=1 Tax=Desulfohalovibrio reitneri TaxID=1307759 RepID=UPI0004A728CC|nr:redoxin domain-containing protein [Desulfohalovibrio reitneri]
MNTNRLFPLPAAVLLALLLATTAWSQPTVYDPGHLKPQDSQLKVAVGDMAPDFTLPAISGGTVSLSDYRGDKIVVLSFVPAAFTPVCSAQWPAYNLAEEEIKKRGAVVIGITTDNLPSIYAWTEEMGGVWFPALSDFWPHGEAASRFGILRSDGTAERATFIIDTKGVIRHIDVHNINERPRLEPLIKALDEVRE